MPLTAKVDYRRELRALYAPGGSPAIVDVPEFAFVMVDGSGDPNNSPAFSNAIEALYAVGYAAKFIVKRAAGVDYVVMPLEGLFWVPDTLGFTAANKSAWCWTLMLMQPDQVTELIYQEARETARRKRSPQAIERVRFERFAEGTAAQVMHVGPYSTEGPTIERLHAFITEQGYEPAGKHHEIYLSDPRRCAPEKMKTVVRQPIVGAS